MLKPITNKTYDNLINKISVMFSALITPFAQNLSENLLETKERACACSIYTIAYFNGFGLYLNQYQVPVDVC